MSRSSGAPEPTSGRRAFSIVTVIFGLGLGLAGFGFLSLVGGWFGAGGREEHRIHDLGYGAVAGVLIAIPFLIQAASPERKPAVMQGLAAAGVGFGAGYALGGAYLFLLGPLVTVAVLWWLHPARERLGRYGRLQPLMAVLALAAAVPLFIYAWDQAAIQRACPPTGDEHCGEFHYAGMAALAFAMPLAGLVASLRAPGWRIVAWLVAGAAAVLGLSSILFPELLSSLGTTWGAVVIAGGVIFALLGELTARRELTAGPA